MKIQNRIELKLENYEKCHIICDSDCPLGQMYDYSCALQHFITQKMKEADEARKSQDQQAEKDPKMESIG